MKRLIMAAAGVALALAAACGGKGAVTTPTGETAQRGTTTAAPATATLEVARRTSTPVIVATIETSPLPATPVSTPTPGLSTYRSDQFGFEFQYSSECTLTEQPDGAPEIGGGSVYLSVTIGSRLDLDVIDPGGLSLADYVNQTADQLKARGASVESISQGPPVGGAESMTVQYRFGGLNRYGEATFFERNGIVYDVSFTAGVFTCFEPQVYNGILSTFRFTGESGIAPTLQAQTAITTEYGIYVVRPDGSGLRRLGPQGPARVWNYSWSPDGRSIAFVETDCVRSTVFLGEPDSESIRQLASVEGQADVAWSPDGQRLLIWSLGGGLTHVLLLDAAGVEEPREPLGGPLAGSWWGFAWSPDSTRIAYIGSGEANVLNVADGQTMTIAEDVGSGISWAPDGTHLAYSTSAGNDVVVVGADGSARSVVAALGLNPQWMPDGQRLIFYRPADDPQRPPRSVAIVPAAGGPVEEVTDGFPSDVSSDGNLVAVHEDEDGRGTIEVFDLAARGSRVVSGQVSAWGELSFSPDGAQLLFRSQGQTGPGLYLVNVDGTGLRHLVQPGTGYTILGKWSPDSRFVAFVVSTGGFCEG